MKRTKMDTAMKKHSATKYLASIATLAVFAALGSTLHAQSPAPSDTPDWQKNVVRTSRQKAAMDEKNSTPAVSTAGVESAAEPPADKTGKGVDTGPVDAPTTLAVDPALAGQDPVSIMAERMLENSGLIKQQAKLGDDILLLERAQSRNKAIEDMVKLVGVDAMRSMHPDLIKELDHAPFVLDARIEQVEKLLELKAALEEMDKPAKEAEPIDVKKDAGVKIPSILGMSGSEKDTTETAKPESDDASTMKRLAANAATQVDPAMSARVNIQSMSLREIYGSENDMTAIATYNGDRVKLRIGDKLPDDHVVKDIKEDRVDIVKNGIVTTLYLRG